MSQSAAQIRLSEGLQLLHEFNYSDPDTPYQLTGICRNRGYCSPETNADMRALDLIAVCLATGDPGDVVAAAFDKHERISLVLAKNGQVTAADFNATHEFFSDLMAATNWIDLIPFLIKHGKTNIDKRIRGLHQSLSAFDIESAVKGYSNDSMEVEFPNSVAYRRRIYPDGNPSFDRMLRDLIHRCLDASDFEVKQDKGSFMKFFLLVVTAHLLQNSRFLKELTRDLNRWNLEPKENLERLNRRLGKVCQYQGIGMLIDRVKRWFPDGNVPFHWVDENVTATGEGRLELCADPMEAVGRVLEELSPPAIGQIKEKFPCLIQNWETRRVVNPRLHAELRIILHLSRPLLSVPLTDRKQLPIGCSKRSCLCCELWIAAFNAFSGMSWVTSGSHGKPCVNWALPGATYEQIVGGEILWDRVDKAVMKAIDTRLVKSLAWESNAATEISDESGYSSDESDGTKAALRELSCELWRGDYSRVPHPRRLGRH